MTVPEAARNLPELPAAEMCGSELAFVPLTWTRTPEGGLVVAGRCDDDKPANYTVTTLLAAHGAPGAKSWEVKQLPFGEVLSGIVNLSLHAVSERELYLSAYEPFKEPEERRAYLARYDGKEWQEVETKARDGLMAVTSDGHGTLWLAGGRALYRWRSGELERVALPPLRFAEPNAQIHVHAVSYLDGELWAEGSYRVRSSEGRGMQWASVLYASRAPDVPLYCDAREGAEAALYEASP